MIDPTYREKIEKIKSDGEEYAYSAMKGVYLEQKAALDELHTIIGKAYIDHAKDGVLVLTTTQQQQLMDSMKAKLKAMGTKLGNSEVEKVTALLGEVFSATYYQNAFVLESGIKANLKFNILKSEFVNSAVMTEFKGEMFSDRIWANKASMIDTLQESIIKAMKGGVHLDKVARDIRDRFNVTAYESQRLVQTETARIQTQATDEIAKSTGVKQQMYSATLDMETNPVDASFDGKIYDVDDESKPDIPQHPNCRCCYINVPYSGWSPTARKENISKEIIDYKDYETWLKDRIGNNPKSGDTNVGNRDILNSDKWLVSDFPSEKKFNKHVNDHIGKYDNITPEQYLELARSLLSEPLSPDIEGFKDKDGFVFKYKNSSNDFVIGRPDGKISTLFKPDDDKGYWLKQIERFKEV